MSHTPIRHRYSVPKYMIYCEGAYSQELFMTSWIWIPNAAQCPNGRLIRQLIFIRLPLDDHNWYYTLPKCPHTLPCLDTLNKSHIFKILANRLENSHLLHMIKPTHTFTMWPCLAILLLILSLVIRSCCCHRFYFYFDQILIKPLLVYNRVRMKIA